MACPICNKRKPKRLCPARAESICSICCGTEREVTIDCPSDCMYLVAGREYDRDRMEIDWSKVPFPEVKFNRRFAETHGGLLVDIDYSICEFIAEHREIVDTDVLVALRRWRRLTVPRRAGLFMRSLWITRCNAPCTNTSRRPLRTSAKSRPAGGHDHHAR